MVDDEDDVKLLSNINIVIARVASSFSAMSSAKSAETDITAAKSAEKICAEF